MPNHPVSRDPDALLLEPAFDRDDWLDTGDDPESPDFWADFPEARVLTLDLVRSRLRWEDRP